MYKDHLYKKVCLDPSAVLTRRAESKGDYANENEELLLKCIILDFSAITYIDPVGVQLLRNMANEYSQLDVAMYVANCSGKFYR